MVHGQRANKKITEMKRQLGWDVLGEHFFDQEGEIGVAGKDSTEGIERLCALAIVQAAQARNIVCDDALLRFIAANGSVHHGCHGTEARSIGGEAPGARLTGARQVKAVGN